MSITIRESEHHRYTIIQGFLIYLIFFRRFPFRALQVFGAYTLIFILMFGALYLNEILMWIDNVLR
jgi:hypothetical protein